MQGRKDSTRGGRFTVMLKREELVVFGVENKARSCSLKLKMMECCQVPAVCSRSGDAVVAIVLFQ